MICTAMEGPAMAAGTDPFGEPVVQTDHQIQIDGTTLHYTAEAGRVAIRDVETGEPHGYMFYVAYRVPPAAGPRPVAFVWNGGPGSSSALLHFEAGGPKRLAKVWGQSKNSVKRSQHQNSGEGVFTLTPNEDTWLTATDLVFVDPIGTGFSRPAKPEYAGEFYGTVGDVASVTEFVRVWRLLHAAEAAPVLLIGESWGAGRAGSVGFELVERGIPLQGLVLISGGTGLNRQVLSPAMSSALRVVDRSATAFHHGRLPDELGDSEAEVRVQAEAWVRDTYAPTLEHFASLTDKERDALIDGLARLTGMPPELIDRETLVVAPRPYREGLLHASGKILDVFDMRLVQEEAPGTQTQDHHARWNLITRYLRDELGYRTDLPYVDLESVEQGYAPGGTYPESVNARWNYATVEVTPEEREKAYEAASKHGGGPPQLGPPLPSAAEAVERQPQLKVLVAAGRFDSLNSCATNEELARNLEGVHKAAYVFRCYEGGHMMYRDGEAGAELGRDVRELAE
jgi:carboxypeptidase C (cathepsin A)